MSCSSKRSRLVGSCMRTLVSSTKSLGTDVLADLVTCSAGRRVRSTMGLLGACGQGNSMLASQPAEYKGLWFAQSRRHTLCGGKGTVGQPFPPADRRPPQMPTSPADES